MSRVKFNTIDEVYAKYPTKSISKFKRIANRYGFTDDEAKHYLNTMVVHDQRKPKPKFMHIYSKLPHAFQMDTFIDHKAAGQPNYLILININTRKAYAYMIHGKGANEIHRALNEFIKVEPQCKAIMSDEDAAYLSNTVLDFMQQHNIIYTTTTDNDHNKLGIINRFMRTIRDMRFNQPKLSVLQIVDSYNDMPHGSLHNKSPNDITQDDELTYIHEMEHQVNPYDFKPGDRVRIVFDANPFVKHRSNLSKVAYIVDSNDGNQFLIRSTDGSVNTMPGYKLIKATSNIPLATTLDDGKRGVVKSITSYNKSKDTYHIIYDLGNGSTMKDTIPSKNMREGHPTKLSTMERQYWLKRKTIPDHIKKFI